ncbi:MAG TPA: hypothetical protein VFE16_09725 [Candidatus Cybelea sp.]|jgi:uncharacterized membrane protein YhaH (DUF805 family)|nr:hypothetical protein [Candidatus Cybelea sp.]
MDRSSAAAASAIAAFAFVYIIVICALIVFTIWVYWRIFSKAGYNGALSLLNFIPGVGPLICVIILAFGRWPIEDQLAALQGGAIPPPVVPPMAPPGSSVMTT